MMEGKRMTHLLKQGISILIKKKRKERYILMCIRSQPGGGKSSSVAPDINTIHKALFNKASSNAQIFTVTLPKKT
jgi:hypothetical protein